MTAAQRSRFYFPAWSAAAKACRWTKAFIAHEPHTPLQTSSPEVNALLARIWDVAEHIAFADRRDVAPDDFRHACHVIAIGRDKSSADLTNDECERVVALYKLLADPDDLGAMLGWNSPDQARRKRMLWWINRNCVESYVVSVCREKFGSDDVRALSDTQLRQLHMTLRNRRNSRKHAPAAQPF